MRRIGWNGWWLGMCLLLSVLLGAGAHAQDSGDPEVALRTAQQQIEQVARDVADIQHSLEDENSVDSLQALVSASGQAQRAAGAAVAVVEPVLARLDARIERLGPPPEGQTEEAEITAQRNALNAMRSEVDAAIRRGNLLSVEAGQLGERAEALRLRLFNANMLHKGPSPLSMRFWKSLIEQFPADWRRFGVLAGQAQDAWRKGLAEEGAPWRVTLAALVSALMLVPLRIWLRRLGRRLAASERAPKGRLRRSGLAIWLLLVSTVLPALAIWLWVDALRAAQMLPMRLELVASQAVVATIVASFLAALSSSVLMPNQPSWRLIGLDDDTSRRLRKYAWGAASVVGVSIVLRALNTAARTSEVTTAALEGLCALAYVALVAAVLRSLSNAGRKEARDDSALRTGWGLLAWLGGHVTLLIALVAALLGYLNLSLFVSSQMVWMTGVVMAAILLMKFVDDLAAWLFHPESRTGQTLMRLLGMGAPRVEQIGVLLSAVLRVGVVMLAVTAISVPYGNSLALASWLGFVSQGVTVGDAVVRPWALVRAVMVLVAGLMVFKVLHQWLVDTYLPKTGLDVGGRNSVSTVTRYVGITVSVLWALAALGIGLEKIALLASALSVGIGFGLQAITQNFVSGLILLAERPVRLGDRVRIGDQEGDIRRISVRATEIQVDDKSTLIVPNSELITKAVRNMTMGSPLGRLQLKFGVPLSTDVTVLRELLLDVYAEHEAVLESPEPNVFIDGIEGGMIIINSNAHVNSPRIAYRTRSEVLFMLLPRLAEAGIPLMTPTDIHVSHDGSLAQFIAPGAPADDLAPPPGEMSGMGMSGAGMRGGSVR